MISKISLTPPAPPTPLMGPDSTAEPSVSVIGDSPTHTRPSLGNVSTSARGVPTEPCQGLEPTLSVSGGATAVGDRFLLLSLRLWL